MQQECKLIIFDLDGVLLDAKEIHFNALNIALSEIDSSFVISREEHINQYDGLPTTKKLEKLIVEKNLPTSKTSLISARKQEITSDLLKQVEHNSLLVTMFSELSKEFHIAVCSNSIHSTTAHALERLGILSFVNLIIGNDDVYSPKPNPEMFLKAMVEFSVAPNETLIVEDSEVGRKAVQSSGATLCPVSSCEDVTYELVSRYAGSLTSFGGWKDDNLNILIPMAGEGSRFANAGYSFPKPLIEVNGKPMIQVVVENLNIDAHYIFIVRREHFKKFALQYLLNNIAPGCDIVILDELTEGAAITTLRAEQYINNEKQLLIANSDQFLEWNSSNFMYTAASKSKLEGLIPVFEATHPKWSYVKINDNGFVTEVAEKKPISNLATAGIYYWRTGKAYIEAAYKMTDADIRTNGEFYIAPIYNQIISGYGGLKKENVGVYKFRKMWGLGTPEDLNFFLQNYKGDF